MDATRSSVFCVTLPGSRHRKGRPQLGLEAREAESAKTSGPPRRGKPTLLLRPLSLSPVSLPRGKHDTGQRTNRPKSSGLSSTYFLFF